MQSSQPSSLEASNTPEKNTQQLINNHSIDSNGSSFNNSPRAWATLVGGFFGITATFGYANSFGVYQDVYTRAGLASPSRISWIGSCQLFFLLFAGLIGGKLLDSGHFRPTLLIGTLLHVFSLFMVSLAHHDKYYQIFLSQGLGVGIGSGLIYLPCLAIQAQYWQKRRALAMGFVATGTAVGGIVFPIMLNQLFNKSSVGFEWGVRASAFVVLGLLTLSNVLMSENPSHTIALKPKADVKSVLKDIPFTISMWTGIPINIGIFFPYFYIQLYSILHGVNQNTAFYMLALLNASSIIGRTLLAHLGDRFGPVNMNILTSLGSAILTFAMFGLKSQASIIVFCILYGIFSGGYLALSSPTLASLCRDPSEYGLRIGLGFACGGFGVLVGNPISGALLGSKFLWWRAIVFNAILMHAGSLIMLLARQMYVKERKTQIL